MRVASILSVARERLVTIQADALLIEAAKLLCRTHRALLVVCDSKGAMTGVITKTDIVRQVARSYGVLSDLRIENVMTTVVTYCKQGLSARCSGAHASARPCPYPYHRSGVPALRRRKCTRCTAGASGRSRGRRTASPRIRHGCWIQIVWRGASGS